MPDLTYQEKNENELHNTINIKSYELTELDRLISQGGIKWTLNEFLILIYYKHFAGTPSVIILKASLSNFIKKICLTQFDLIL
jgi:hypothetical protein